MKFQNPQDRLWGILGLRHVVSRCKPQLGSGLRRALGHEGTQPQLQLLGLADALPALSAECRTELRVTLRACADSLGARQCFGPWTAQELLNFLDSIPSLGSSPAPAEVAGTDTAWEMAAGSTGVRPLAPAPAPSTIHAPPPPGLRTGAGRRGRV